MEKIPTLFRRNPDKPAELLPEWQPGCEWVHEHPETAVARRKYDGTAVMLDSEGFWWARRIIKAPGAKAYPENFVAAGPPDPTTGKQPGWMPARPGDYDRFAELTAAVIGPTREADPAELMTGTYELCGPTINGNPEGFLVPTLIRHVDAYELPRFPVPTDPRQALAELEQWLWSKPYEGVVWWEKEGTRRAKLKLSDFGRKRQPSP